MNASQALSPGPGLGSLSIVSSVYTLDGKDVKTGAGESTMEKHGGWNAEQVLVRVFCNQQDKLTWLAGLP